MGKPKSKKKIAIVGAAFSSRTLAPYDDPAWEVWGLNTSYTWQPRWDRWFDIHDPETIKGSNPGHWEWLAKQSTPVYMQKQVDEIPASVEYPLDMIRDLYGDYLTNSISYMVALAISHQPHTIGIWGVDMAQDNTKREQSEYAHQRPSCEYFVGIARGLGIEVIIAPESDLLKTAHVYGFGVSETSAWDQKLTARRNELEQRIKIIQSEIQGMKTKYDDWFNAKQAEAMILTGALEEAKYERQFLPYSEGYNDDKQNEKPKSKSEIQPILSGGDVELHALHPPQPAGIRVAD